jgi:subtilase family serine protease
MLGFETLEARFVLSASLGVEVSPKVPVASLATSGPTGLTPVQIWKAYGFDKITFNNSFFGVVPGTGAGQTIAIVDAYSDPNIASDLAKFDAQFGLAPPPSFKVVNQNGGTSLPRSNRGWASEIALDVEWAHAIAPGANILLVEANSAFTSDLNKALDYARSAAGVVVVSNSWGGSEYSSELSDDVHFTTPAGHQGVTFTVAAGDNGTPAEYPSSSPNVLSVGGSTLRLNSSGAWSSETVWSGGGGGASTYESLPSYQSGLGLSSRGTPDVSYDADPYTGFSVYDSYGSRGWVVFGGTSAGAPQWAALIAIAAQGRALNGQSSLANVQSILYGLPRSDFHDITSGSNGISAKSGYDLASGLGSPIANLVVPGLVAYAGSTSFSAAAPAAVTPSSTSLPWWWNIHLEGGGDGGSAAPAFAVVADSRGDALAVPVQSAVTPSAEVAFAVENGLSALAITDGIATDAGGSLRHRRYMEIGDGVNTSSAFEAFFAGLDGAARKLIS